MVFARGVAVEEAANEGDDGDALEFGVAAPAVGLALRAHQILEAVRVAKRVRGERGDHLRERYVTI